MDILNNRPSRCSSTPNLQCSICLGDLTDACCTETCLHLHCFECLQRWAVVCSRRSSRSKPTCPLCKRSFIFIYQPGDSTQERLLRWQRFAVRPLSEPLDYSSRNFVQDQVDNNQVDFGQLYHLSPNPGPSVGTPMIGQGMRTNVYVYNAWAIPLPDSTGRFRHCTSDFYRDHPTQAYRLHEFCLRDVVAMRTSVREEGQAMPFPENTDVYFTNLIIRSLGTYEIKQLHLVNALRPFLNEHAEHFFHELYNFANSPYEISDYDRNVQFIYVPDESELTPPFSQTPPIQIVGNNEEIQTIIEASSICDHSDVEILSHSFPSTVNSVPVDQPSTSTLIRDSLDRPNNRRRQIFSLTVNDSSSFQSLNGGLSRVSYSSQVKRGRSNLDSSSDDE